MSSSSNSLVDRASSLVLDRARSLLDSARAAINIGSASSILVEKAKLIINGVVTSSSATTSGLLHEDPKWVLATKIEISFPSSLTNEKIEKITQHLTDVFLRALKFALLPAFPSAPYSGNAEGKRNV